MSFLALAVFFLWSWIPGAAVLRRVPHAPTDPLARFALAWAVGLSLGLIATSVHLYLHLPVTTLKWVLSALALVGAFTLAVPRAGRTESEEPRPTAWIYLTLPFLAFCGWYQGGPFTLVGDGPELVAGLREILHSGSLFPQDTHFLNAGASGEDIRKGLLHPWFAAGILLLGGDALATWLHLPLLFAVFPFLSAYTAVKLMGYRPGVSFLAAWLLVLTFNGGLAGQYAAMSSNPKVVAAGLFWISSGLAVACQVRGSKGLGILSALTGIGAGLAHPMILVFLAGLYGTLLLWSLFIHRKPGTYLLPVLLLGAGLTPYYVVRYQVYDPQNPIHLELQGMLFLGEARVFSPMQWFRDAGWLAFPGYTLFFVSQWKRLKRPEIWWGWWAILAMGMLAFNPWLVPLVERTISYLVFRLPWMFPAAFAVALLFASRPRSWKRVALLILLALFLAPSIIPLVTGVFAPPSRAHALDMVRHAPAFEELDVVLPPRSVVLADPTTSYLIPALTSQKVVCTFDQHGSPNDARALERILTAREVLSPGVSDSLAWNAAHTAGATHVLLWPKSPLVPSLYWQADAFTAGTRVDQLRASPWFREVELSGPLALFALEDAAPDSASVPAMVFGRIPERPPLIESHGLRLWAKGVRESHVSTGDLLEVPVLWQRTPEYAMSPLRVTLRLTSQSIPGGSAWGGKLWRKAQERLTGETYQTRAGVPPGGGSIPPTLWPEDRSVDQTIPLRIPGRMRPGAYRLELVVNRMPAMPNYSAGDYLYNQDVFSGAVFDTVWVDP